MALPVGAALAALVANCKVYPDSLLDPLPEADAGAGPVDGSPGIGFWSGPNETGCYSAGQPTEEMRPAPTDAPSIEPVYFAVSRLLLGSETPEGKVDENAWTAYGLDLDGVCSSSPTCPDVEGVACKSINPRQSYDGNECRDNTFGHMEYFVTTIKELGEGYQLNDKAFNCGLAYGQYNMLIKISEYNGEANDDTVRVDLYPSPGLEEPVKLSCADFDTKNNNLPFNTAAPWFVDEASMPSPAPGPKLPDAKIFDAKAYVREGIIVARFADKVLLRFPDTNATFRPFPLYLTRGIVTARVAKGAGGTWELQGGTIAGRVLYDDVIQGFRQIGFCENEAAYTTMKNYTKASLDLLSTGEVDASKDCDALSMGVVFEAIEATPGKLAKVEPLIDCPQKKATTGN